MSISQSNTAVASGHLVDLVSTTSSSRVYPSDDALLTVLQARFRADLPYSRIGATNLVVVNPFKTLDSVNDASAKEYEERSYRDTSLPLVDPSRPLQPHLYETAAQLYLLMRRRNESQSVITQGITGSGKSSSLRLLLNQLLRLSAHSKKELKLADQVKALCTLLDSFGNAKTLMSANASRHARYLELHFSETGRIMAAKVLAFGLDKNRLIRLTHEERTYHVFYQFIAGATPAERDKFNIEDPSDYALLASSGCYRLPAGPFSDDSIALTELRAAMRTLGFKPKHVLSIFSLIIAVLSLGNLQFGDGDARDVSAHVTNQHALEQVSKLLGVAPEDLNQILTNRTSYVRKELCTILLNAEQSARQRDQFVKDIYSILFAFIVESCNHKLAPNSKDTPLANQVILFDQPGFQTRGPSGTTSISLTGNQPLISAYGQNGFDEFCINFSAELLHSYYVRYTFDTIGYNGFITGDGVSLPEISAKDNGSCVELLRGALVSERAQRKPGGLLGVVNKACSSFKSGKDADSRNVDLVQDLSSRYSVHSAFVDSNDPAEKRSFGINHYAGTCSYDASQFIEKDCDLLDSAFVSLLRGSSEPFISKLFSGPSLAAERHSKDEGIIVQAQVSSRPLRQPTPVEKTLPEDEHPRLDPNKTYPITTQLNFSLSEIFSTLDRTRLWSILCIRPNDSSSPNSFDKRRVKSQIQGLLLPEIVARRSVDYVVDFELGAFCDRYVPTMQGSDQERIIQCARANGWKEGSDFCCGHRFIWLSYGAWKMVEDPLRTQEKEMNLGSREGEEEDFAVDDNTDFTHAPAGSVYYGESVENLLLTRKDTDGTMYKDPNAPYGSGGLRFGSKALAPPDDPAAWSESDKKEPGTPELPYSPTTGNGAEKGPGGLVVKEAPVEEIPSSKSRRWWLRLVWLCTFWIPSFCLKYIGRMKRPDVRMAWREKVTICWLIFLMNAVVVFYIVEFGRLLCPNYDKAWSLNEVNLHTGDNDFWVTIQGVVYDVTNFIHGDHSKGEFGVKSNSPDILAAIAGQDLTYYFPPPLILGCNGLVQDDNLALRRQNFTDVAPLMHHTSGRLQSTSPEMEDSNWYINTFWPKMQSMRKGPLVWDWAAIQSGASNADDARIWGVYNHKLYDLTDYVYTLGLNQNSETFSFLDDDFLSVFKQRSGQDITKPLDLILNAMNSTYQQEHMACIENVFLAGQTDFRKTPRCQVQNYMLIVISGILMASIGLKFLAALQLGTKRSPELQDKFVICQVPCYTEDEDSLRRTIDSLAALNYDDKRKLIFIICDGNIIGSGNDRTTPQIVLDIVGMDPTLDPEPLMFKSVGEGSRAVNYGKVYSGLYEFEGHVVPYLVVVKVGKPSERSKPGNRGKRDSQILLLHYLNKVHFDAPMSPLELEIYHQMRNVIGVDPAFYEYIFTVDADTSVTPESLNRLVAQSSDDSRIIGICGETKLTNEDYSWWTWIQVYEYYISHHLSKAFESLFGSVTCLPGCFTLYRIRTADKGRPIIISSRIIEEYAEPNIDTLHKKNLFSLGEDRFLTTLMMKHFPTFKTKFCPHAVAHTTAPESWRVLFSQRRRWINSTVHNLCELVVLPELFGFCCFSMRFFVFIDLLGTIILPATVVYLVYLVVNVALHATAFPRIAIIMLAVVYGLQAIIFILKREFMLVGWMIVYILSYPIYSFFLPVYSFWCMDEFSWGNTRVVIGEGKGKKVITNDEDKFDDSMIPVKKFSEYEAEAWDTRTHHSDETGYDSKPHSRSHTRSRPASPHTTNNHASNSDYYRNTNAIHSSHSVANLRTGGSQLSHSNLSIAMPFTAPQLPVMPFVGGSISGSDHGHMMPMPMAYQNTGSMYGLPPMMNTMQGMNMNMNMFGGSPAGSQIAAVPPSMPPMGLGMGQRPMSTFSMATTVNMFGPSNSTNPTDEELFLAIRNYLSTQDLMTVTKKTAREAIASKFPKADLTTRKDFLNQSIDKILSES